MPRPVPTRVHLGRVLRAYREAAGLSQEAMGFRAGLHRNYIGSAERGERNIAFEAIGKWLQGLGLAWTEFGAALDREATSTRDSGDHRRSTRRTRRP